MSYCLSFRDSSFPKPLKITLGSFPIPSHFTFFRKLAEVKVHHYVFNEKNLKAKISCTVPLFKQLILSPWWGRGGWNLSSRQIHSYSASIGGLQFYPIQALRESSCPPPPPPAPLTARAAPAATAPPPPGTAAAARESWCAPPLRRARGGAQCATSSAHRRPRGSSQSQPHQVYCRYLPHKESFHED
jgi:hypothetical protein